MKNIGTGKRDEFYRQNAEENKGEETKKYSKTRPDTRPSVADGWAGASNLNPHHKSPTHMHKKHLKRSFPHFSTRVHGPTDQPTDGRTKPLIELCVRN